MHDQQCPKCHRDISDSYEPADPSVGIMSEGYYCDYCEEFVIPISFARSDPSKPLGTPLSELSTQLGQPGYEEWCRISRSWGYD